LVGRVVAHPDGADLPGRDGVGHVVHQARDVHPPRWEVVLVHVDVVASQPGQTVGELARHVVGGGPQGGREFGGDQGFVA
jgi:hypothetical protein